MSTLTDNKTILIESVWFDKDSIFVKMNNDQIIQNPIDWFPNLKKGTINQLKNFSIEANGRWIHWEELDEDLSVEGFLKFKG